MLQTQRYLATVLPGFEEILCSEIRVKLPDSSIKEILRGKVIFTSQQPLNHLTMLRCADNLYIFINRFSVGPHRTYLKNLEYAVSELDLFSAISLSFSTSNVNAVKFMVNASKAGKQTYNRFEASEAAIRGLLSRYPSWEIGSSDEDRFEFRLDIIDDEALFSLRLTPSTFRFRGSERFFSQAALHPTVAHALTWLSEPDSTDYFLDPFCGSGTIIAERCISLSNKYKEETIPQKQCRLR